MTKYRSLSKEELVPLEDDFISFLVLNGITGDDWKKIVKNDPQTAQQMTEQFSDVVWEGILRKAEYLVYKSNKSIKCFHCQKEKIVLVGLDSEHLDLLSTDLTDVKVSKAADGLSVYTSSKAYSKVREKELYDMLNWGCEITDGELYKILCLAL